MSFISKFTKRDLGFAVLTGLITGTIAWQIFEYLKIPEVHLFYTKCLDSCQGSIPWVWLVVIIPILWILGVLLGYFLGQWFGFFNQFGKFAAIGFTNAGVDFGILNVLISQTGFLEGKEYAVLKGASFLVALVSSYIWNKHWAFRSNTNQNGAFEFFKFFLVTVISFVINVGIASVVVTYIQPVLGLNAHTWANVGAVVGSAVALIFSFVGFKLAVFKK